MVSLTLWRCNPKIFFCWFVKESFDVKEPLLRHNDVHINTQRCVSKEAAEENEGRRAGRKASRKLIPPQAAIFSARIRSSCGSASAGIRPLVRESPSIKIHDGWPGAEGSQSRRKGRRKRKKSSLRGKERAMVAQQVAWRKRRADTHTRILHLARACIRTRRGRGAAAVWTVGAEEPSPVS